MQRRTVQYIFFFTLLLLTTLAFLGLIQDFLQPVFWAAVFAIIFRPIQDRWESALGGRPAIAAVLTILTIVVIVLLPLAAVGAALARESMMLYNQLLAGQVDIRAPIQWIESQMPLLADYLDRFGIELDALKDGLSEAAVVGSQVIAQQALAIGQNALRFGVQLFVMLYVLFFFLRDSKKLVDSLIWALPLGDQREMRLFRKFAEVARATIKGSLVIGVIQGGLGGLFFWWLGITAPVLWGVVMTILSFLPAVGAALVWGPAALILIFTGEVVRGLILLALGALVISVVDNILRPILVGRDTQMPDFLILLSTLGGLTIFGISGVVIGPIIAAFFLTVWQMFGDEFAQDRPGDEDPGEEHEPTVPPAEAPRKPTTEPVQIK